MRFSIYRRGFLLSAIAAAIAALFIPLRLALRAYQDERETFRASRHPPRKSLLDFGIPELRAVSFPSRAGTRLSAYYAPSKSGAAVLLAHGSGGDRSDVSDEARALNEAGFAILAFDWPGHGESEGEIHWGEPERQALESALDWLAQQPSVDPKRLGGYGFSMGGYTLTQVAARDPRLKAVALASSPHDALEQTCWEHRTWGFVTRWPALLALRTYGADSLEQVPVRVVTKIAPRAVLIISGSKDDTVPPWMSRRLFEAAGSPKQLLTVPEAGHGDYAAAAPATYLRELSKFFLHWL